MSVKKGGEEEDVGTDFQEDLVPLPGCKHQVVVSSMNWRLFQVETACVKGQKHRDLCVQAANTHGAAKLIRKGGELQIKTISQSVGMLDGFSLGVYLYVCSFP